MGNIYPLRLHRRTYADVRDDVPEPPLIWPDPSHPSTRNPTPYQIFCISPTAPYSKSRFYELVKLYHPDRHHSNSLDVPTSPTSTTKTPSHAILIERYRLVVAANEILSSPTKRSTYDRYGTGWDHTPRPIVNHAHNAQHSTSHAHHHEPFRRNPSHPRGWGQPSHNHAWHHHSPHHNATWEDWERYYQREAKGPQEPRFFANGAFITLVVVLATLGGVGQATRVGGVTLGLFEERERLHDESSRELMRRRLESREGWGMWTDEGETEGARRDQRIRRFLEEREKDTRYVETEEGDQNDDAQGYVKMLPAPGGGASSQPMGKDDRNSDQGRGMR